MIASQATPSTGSDAADMEPREPGVKAPTVDLKPYTLRFNTLKLEYMSKWFSQHRDLSRYINPKRGFYEGMVPNWNGQIDYKLIMDGGPADDARTLAAGMSSGMTSSSQPWFKLGLTNPRLMQDSEVKSWLDAVEEVLYAIFDASNIHEAFQSCYEELGIFGTGAFGIYEDYESVIRCRSYTMGEYFLGYDGMGRLNTFARQFNMTVSQLVSEFGYVNCSDTVQQNYKAGHMDTFVQVCQLIKPNTERVNGRADYTGKKYSSCYWEFSGKSGKALDVGGYDELPIMGPLWETVTTADSYGIGPGWYARGDIKSLYTAMKDLFLGVAMGIRPPTVQSSKVESSSGMIPGGLIRVSGDTADGHVVPAYQVKPDIQWSLELIRMLKSSVSQRFYADLFKMMLRPDAAGGVRTAREIVESQRDKLLLLGPVISRIKTNMLNPAIGRTFAIAFRKQLIPPPPPQIQGSPFRIQYIGLLAQAQKMAKTAAVEQGMSFVGSVAAAYPEARDLVNIDEVVREYWDDLGISAKGLRAPEEVEAVREAQAQQIEQQKQMQDAASMVQGAKVLSETPVGDASALERMLGYEGASGGRA